MLLGLSSCSIERSRANSMKIVSFSEGLVPTAPKWLCWALSLRFLFGKKAGFLGQDAVLFSSFFQFWQGR